MFKSAKAARLMASTALLIPLVALQSSTGSASSSVQFGSLSNFDVFNDTGQVTHGFEIELDGISSTDVTYRFGAPYERYGDPQVVTIAGGVDIVYASPYDAGAHQFTQGTPLAPLPISPTGGHACWTGGSANYPTAGCEHFGLGLSATPTNVICHWLVADPAHLGSLIPLGGGVQLPAPIWSAAPPPVGALNPAPVVQAVVQAPEPDLGQPLGDAVWVKVFVTESKSAADLNHLVTGDKAVPNTPAQTETEWALIQAGSGGGLATELVDQAQMAKGSESVTRRFEFYTYIGAYDPSGHEALPINDAVPAKGDLGSLIGTQMGALNLAPGGVVPGDHTAPRVVIDQKPPSSTRVTTARFIFHATDPDNHSFNYFCALDRAIPAPCVSAKLLNRVSRGRHTFKIFATDTARNPSAPLAITWTVTK